MGRTGRKQSRVAWVGCREEVTPYCKVETLPSLEQSSLWSRDQKEVEGRVWCQLCHSSSCCTRGPSWGPGEGLLTSCCGQFSLHPFH